MGHANHRANSSPESGFVGFTAQSLAFLSNIKANNSKIWYQEQKALYEQVLLNPFRELVSALAPTMQVIDDRFEVRPAVGKTLSRLYRDTRFSKDKSLFRDRMWLVFKQPKTGWTDAPAYFFELRPEAFCYGLGYYAASRDTMDRFRHMILHHAGEFHAATDSLLPEFQLVGESYKRPLIKQQPEAIANWYNRKSFAVMVEASQFDAIFSGQLVGTLQQGFQKLAPLYDLLRKVELMKQIPLEDL
jgi:uncharacterized protein (TIGR02453 family)